MFRFALIILSIFSELNQNLIIRFVTDDVAVIVWEQKIDKNSYKKWFRSFGELKNWN